MFDNNLKSEFISMAAGSAHSSAYQSTQSALILYKGAVKSGKRHKLLAGLTGRNSSLKDLNQITAEGKVLSSRYAGMRTVLIKDIHGSEGRTEDFDSDFHPLKNHNRDRWTGVARARLQDQPLPAVELIQVGDEYFVRDGHHRISVARVFGQEAIDAQVTILDVAGLSTNNELDTPRREQIWKAIGA